MKNTTGMQAWSLLLCYVVAALTERASTAQLGHPSGGGLQVIRRLGENRSGALKVSQGRSRGGESPIYFIRLPPTPYFYMPNVVMPYGLPHEKVPVEFTNNGRPNQVYHWNLPELNTQVFQPSLSPTESPVRFPADAPASAPADIPAEAPANAPADIPADIPADVPAGFPAAPDQDSAALPMSRIASSKESYASGNEASSIDLHAEDLPEISQKKRWFKKHYSYNGRPSGVYIFKSKRPIYVNKYRRPLGKLLTF